MHDLSPDDRLRLLEFVCSFAWTDLVIQDEERQVIERLIGELDMDPAHAARARGWLKSPPPIDDLDPTDIPMEHRQMFYEAARDIIEADGRVSPDERDSLEIFRELLHDS